MKHLVEGPPQYSDLTEVALAYINKLEERVHTLIASQPLNVIHPWDQLVEPDSGNSLGVSVGVSANYFIRALNEQIESLKTVHPWDQPVEPSESNPLGRTAREIMDAQDEQIESFKQTIMNLRKDLDKVRGAD